MSDAERFDFRRGLFPSCLPVSASPGTSGLDYVDISVAAAMNLMWNLEELEFVSTGTESTGDINWTVTYGPAESLPFTDVTLGRSGAYYTAAKAPARPPASRVCASPVNRPVSFIAGSSSGTEAIELEIIFAGIVSGTGLVRMLYSFYGYELIYLFGNLIAGVAYFSPARQSFFEGPGFTGSPSSTGTISILGISMNWKGGGLDYVTDAWTASAVTLTATSAAFTYP